MPYQEPDTKEVEDPTEEDLKACIEYETRQMARASTENQGT